VNGRKGSLLLLLASSLLVTVGGRDGGGCEVGRETVADGEKEGRRLGWPPVVGTGDGDNGGETRARLNAKGFVFAFLALFLMLAE